MARPRRFSSAVADRICERLLEGRSLKSICQDRGMPAASTVFRWLAEDPAFSRRYAQARQAQADALFEQFRELNASIRWMRSPEAYPPPAKMRPSVSERDDAR